VCVCTHTRAYCKLTYEEVFSDHGNELDEDSLATGNENNVTAN
jgi:hypothetical protein